MGIFSKRNIDKAKTLAEKNKDKIASTVSKATEFIDDKTGGKHADKLKKVDDAAAKYAGTADAAAASTDATDTDDAADTSDTSDTAETNDALGSNEAADGDRR